MFKMAIGLVALLWITNAAHDQTAPVGSSPSASGRTSRPAPSINKTKFAAVYRSSKALHGATKVGVNYMRYVQLLQAFAAEMEILKEEPLTSRERILFGLFDNALAIYEKCAGDAAMFGDAARIMWPYASGQLEDAYGLYSRNVVSKKAAAEAGRAREVLKNQ